MSPKLLRNSFIYVIIAVAAIAMFFTFFQPSYGSNDIPISEVVELAKTEQLQTIEIKGDDLTITTRTGTTFTSRKEEGSSLVETLERANIDTAATGLEIVIKGGGGFGSVFGILLSFLPLIFFGGLLLFMMKQAQGSGSQTMNFGRSKARVVIANRPSVAFSDVAGEDEAKEELAEIVEFLKFPERFTSLGAHVPRGVLLIGPPGTGKTLLAKAVAGEAEVPFFSISGSEFVEMFVGVGASRVRDLFDQAKRNAPSIIFVDEIDAVGRHRGAGLGGGHDEREQTLNQILVEMDGFDTGANVIVLAATNRPDILDPALLRPGRFDRRVVLDLPDVVGRTAILNVHAKGKPLDEETNLEIVSKQTPGFSGADLANLVNEAAILAGRARKKTIGPGEFAEAIDRVESGPEKKSRVYSEHEKEITAYHEAGHAIVGHTLPNADPVQKISVVARGNMGGYTRFLPEEDRHMWSKAQFKDRLAMAMGGRVAEELIFVDITTGASNDLEIATNIARQMVTRYGMSEKLGPRTFGKREEMVFLGREITEQRDYSDRVAEEIDAEVHSLLEEAYDLAKQTLTKANDKLHQVAKYLIEHETVEGDSLQALFSSEAPTGAVTNTSDYKTKSTPTEEKPKTKSATRKPRTPKGRSSGPNTAPAPAS
ncbi:MAG: ATP-dependent metallopeptidase FtsH/Yme1/Tma family protein [SAR202 cluster bacterium]|nr:ATP-dependent metallopeptidase FtsH/Yme1/Tma family protein [SAR202 cluster bacterium]